MSGHIVSLYLEFYKIQLYLQFIHSDKNYQLATHLIEII